MNSKRDHSNQVIRVLSDSRGEYYEEYDNHNMEILGVSSFKELEKLIRSKSLKTL